MKQFVLAVILVVWTAGCSGAVPQFLATPKFDSTFMPSNTLSRVAAPEVHHFFASPVTEWTYTGWVRANLTAAGRAEAANGMSAVYSLTASVTTAPARSTAEGGATLAEAQPWSYDTPLTLDANGCFAHSSALPASIVCDSITNTVLCVNVETDSTLTLSIGGQTKTIAASNDKQIFNLRLDSADRTVSVAAADPAATVKLGWAVMPYVEFHECQTGVMGFDANGGLSPVVAGFGDGDWVMVSVRGKIESGNLVTQSTLWNATNSWASATLTNATDAVRFEADARIMIQSMAFAPEYFGAAYTYGFKFAPVWLTDEKLRRIRDVEARTLYRRGHFQSIPAAWWQSIH